MENIFESWLVTTPISHRGVYNNIDIAENSESAFLKAIEMNYSIELDVRMLSDETIVVFHDEKLSRMTGADGYIDNLTYPQIQHLKLLNTDDRILTLKQVLEIVNGRVPLLIEIKNNLKVGVFEKRLMEILKDYNGEFAVQSFNPFVIEWFKNNAPHITRGLLSGYFKKSKLSFAQKYNLKRLKYASLCQPHFINYDINYLPNRFVKRKDIVNLPLLAYTIKSENEYLKAIKYCDNIIFDGFIPTI